MRLFNLQPSKQVSCYIEILFIKKNSLNKQGQNSIHKQSKWKASLRNFYDLIQPSKLAVLLQFYSQKKNSLNKQGWNSIHKLRRWKASWRKSFSLDSTFKTICYIEILFTKNSLNRQGQNSFRKQSKWKATWRNFYDLIQPSKLAVLLQFFSQKQVKWGFTNYQLKKLLKTTTCHEVWVF